MTNRVTDSLTGGAGTLLTAHVGEVGATWTPGTGFNSGNSPVFDSTGGRIRSNVAGGFVAVASGVATADGEYAEAVIDWLSAVGGVGVLTRAHVSLGGVARGYMGYFTGSQVSILRLDNATTFATLAAGVAYVPTVGTHTHKIVATGVGASVVIDVYADGVLVRTFTDSGASRITTLGSCGIYFDTVRTDTTGAHMTSIVQEDPNAGGATGLTLTGPADGRVCQRTGTTGTVPVTGTYTGAPTTIEARLVLDGTSTAVSGFDWSTKVASPSGSAFAFDFTAVPQGVWYNVQIRDSAVPATVSTSGKVGVGALVALLGQSNAWLWFARGDSTLTPDARIRVIGSGADNGTSGVNAAKMWAVPATGTMNGCIAFGNRVAGLLSTLVGVIDVSWDGSGLTVTGNGGKWLPTNAVNQPYDRLKTFLNTITSKLEAAVIVNGETDGAGGVTQAAFYAGMGTLISTLRADFGTASMPIITPLLAKRSSSITDANAQAIRNAQVQKAGDTAIYRVERTHLTMNADGVHHDAPGYTKLGDVCGQALGVALGAASYYRGPQIASALQVSASVFDITLTHNGGTDFTPASSITGFRVLDGATPIAVSSGVRQAANKIRLTLASAPAAMPTIQYMYGTSPVVTGVVLDNSPFALPLEFNDGVTATPAAITADASWTEGSEVFAMAITASAPPAGVTAAAAWTEGSEAFALVGTVDAAPVTAAASWTEGSETFAAVISVSAPGTVTAAAAWTEGSEQFAMDIEVQTFYARAPAGGGYTPRAGYGQVRPADIQGYRQ